MYGFALYFAACKMHSHSHVESNITVIIKIKYVEFEIFKSSLCSRIDFCFAC